MKLRWHVHWPTALRRIGRTFEVETCRCGKSRMVWNVTGEGDLWTSGWGSRDELSQRLREYASEAPGPRRYR